MGFRNDFKKWVDDSEKAIENEETLHFDTKLGMSMIAWIVFLQIINYTVIVYSTFKDIKWKLHLRKLKKRSLETNKKHPVEEEATIEQQIS